MVELCLVLTSFWYSQQHGCLRSFWRVLFYGFVFVVPLFLVAPICSFRTMQPHGLGAPRVGTVGALREQNTKKRHDTKNTKYKKYKKNTKYKGLGCTCSEKRAVDTKAWERD